MKKAPIEIGYRAREEVLRLFEKDKDARAALGCGINTITHWGEGDTPGAIYLARLHELGADVIYILTGRREERKTNGR